jgi:cytochrome c biogenesis protein CcmG/thiol:disulfide interchange protein DsbE
MTTRRLLTLLPLAAFVGLAIHLGIGLTGDPRRLPSMLIDQAPPTTDLAPLSEAKPGFADRDLAGQVSLVNFWASWCAPCRIEHPQLETLAREGITVIGVNYKDQPQAALAFLRALGDPYRRIGVDREGRAAIDWGVYGVPETFVVDRHGRVRYRHVGPITETDLAQKIRPLIAELRRP